MTGWLSWDLHIGWLVLGGLAMVAMVVLPRVLHARPLSVPIIYVAVGFAAFSPSDQLRGPRPLGVGFDSAAIQYVTEFIVIISLVGAGLRIERRPGLIRWNSVWRLPAVAMTLSILDAIGLAGLLLGLAAAPAILLAGVLAPTDPVLADDVQVGGPGDDDEDEVRFTLTAEAGLNDALAFPRSPRLGRTDRVDSRRRRAPRIRCSAERRHSRRTHLVRRGLRCVVIGLRSRSSASAGRAASTTSCTPPITPTSAMPSHPSGRSYR